MFRKTVLMSTAALCIAAPAFANVTAYATTDLNLRAGPGPQYEVIDVIPGQQGAEVEGCLETGDWCKVSYDGTEGWAYGAYLSAAAEKPMPIYGDEAPQAVVVETITYETPDGEDGMQGAAAGAVIGALIGGPAVIGAGLVAGAVVGATVDPVETTVTYVRNNPVEPVLVQGEVVKGAILPPEVTIYDIPESEYKYVTLNGTTVLVDSETREIVYIF